MSGQRKNDSCWELGSRSLGVDSEGSVFNGYRVSTWKMGRALEIDSGDGCTTMGMCLVPMNWTFKNG